MESETTKLIAPQTTNSYNTSIEKPSNKKQSSSLSKNGLIAIAVVLLLILSTALYSHSSSNGIFNHASKSSSSSSSTTTTPNIIFILMDDMGYGDISIRGSEYSTPNFDDLYSDSIVINSHYIGLVCSPSRSQMLSGRYAWNFGLGAQKAFGTSVLAGLPTGLPILPQLLTQYTSTIPYMVGKWGIGYSTDAQLPLSRGFTEFHGFIAAQIDYETKEQDGYVDWYDNDEIDYDTIDTFGTFVTGDKVAEIVTSHTTNSPDSPFYIYTAFEAVHSTLLNVDSDYSDTCNVINADDDENRSVMCENVLAVDQALGTIRDSLKDNNQWDNTLIIFTSDNGGSYPFGACNYPLRGGKDTFFEGGIKTIAFMTGGYVTELKNNKKYANSQKRYYDKDSYTNGLNLELHADVSIDDDNYDIDIREGFMHGTDWVPTLLTIAGANVDTISNDLQENLYIPIAKEISLSQDGTEDNYKTYLADTSFDGSDVSEWLLYGDSSANTRDNVPLCVNIQLANPSDDTSTNDDSELEDYDLDSEEATMDNAIIFTSSYTGHVYKLMYLEENLDTDGRNVMACTFDEKEDSSKMFKVNDDTSSTSKEYTKGSYVPDFATTNKLLFDMTLESNEENNLVELVTDDDESTSTMADDLQNIVGKYFEGTGRDGNDNEEENIGSDVETYEINSVNEYDYDLVLLLWEEGIKLISGYSNSVLFNNELSCQIDKLMDDADPSQIGDGTAWAPFYEWEEYTTQFESMCSEDINVVLTKFYQSKYTDYM